MDVKIKAIRFDVSERLTNFINKKAQRLARHNEKISNIDVNLKVVKPESAMNKEVIIRISVPQHDDIIASKTANSFEEAIDNCLEAIKKQLEKKKATKILHSSK